VSGDQISVHQNLHAPCNQKSQCAQVTQKHILCATGMVRRAKAECVSKHALACEIAKPEAGSCISNVQAVLKRCTVRFKKAAKADAIAAGAEGLQATRSAGSTAKRVEA
jgi:hypothetical protein